MKSKNFDTSATSLCCKAHRPQAICSGGISRTFHRAAQVPPHYRTLPDTRGLRWRCLKQGQGIVNGLEGLESLVVSSQESIPCVMILTQGCVDDAND